MKWLIVNGDDFGASGGINRGIVQAHREGILMSASLLVDRPASVDAAALARQHPHLSVGLHLELDAGDSEVEGVAAQCERQLARFRELTGTLPTHVDSHHDVHRDPRMLPHGLATSGSSTGTGAVPRIPNRSGSRACCACWTPRFERA